MLYETGGRRLVKEPNDWLVGSYVLTQDVDGLSELRWPNGSVIIQIDELSAGWQNVFSNHKEQILTTEY
jgi:hypothetical protein